jgi:hypothetical protein
MYRIILCPEFTGFMFVTIQQSFSYLTATYIAIILSDNTKHLLVVNTGQLMLCREIIAVCSEINTKHINTLCRQNVELLNVKLAVHIVTSVL